MSTASERLETALNRVSVRLWGVVEDLPLFLVAVVIVVVFFLLARWVSRWKYPFEWMTPNLFLQDLLRQLARVLTVLMGLILGLEILDATALVGAVLGAAGVAGLALGFAFRDLVENYLAGILLGLRRPFAPNDFVSIEGYKGRVARLSSRATILITLEGNHVRIPNAVVFKATIENFTRKPERRFSIAVGVGNEENLASVQELGEKTLAGIEGVLADPAPSSLIQELGDYSVQLLFLGWVDQREADFGKVRSEAIRLLKQAFDDADVSMPEPSQQVVLRRHRESAEEREHPPVAAPQARDISPSLHLDEIVSKERATDEGDYLSDEGANE